jgi:hypothetical protein
MQVMSCDDLRQITCMMGSMSYGQSMSGCSIAFCISFLDSNVAILAHAIIKDEDQVPDMEIQRAIQRKLQFEANPTVHTYVEEIENGKDE